MSCNPDDRASELRDLFFQSAQELLQALNEQGLLLERNPDDAEIVREVRRTVHTLKGDAAACGLRELSELAHELEDVLAPLSAAANAAQLAQIVLSAADMFDAMLAAYRAGLEPPSGDPLRAMIWNLAQKAPRPESRRELRPAFAWSEYEQLSLAEAAVRGLHVFNIALALAPDCSMRAAGLQLIRNLLQEAGTLLACAPEEASWANADRLELAISTERDEAWMHAKCQIPGVVAQMVLQPFVPEEAPDTAPALPETISAAITAHEDVRGKAKPAAPLSASENSLRVDADRIDSLLNQVGELVIAKSMLYQALNEFSERFPKDPLRARLTDALAFHSQVLNALQRSAMQIRMVPVEQLFRRFPRLVRDLGKLCGKQVNLEITGQETALDKRLLDALAEPLAHLVRNAVDHGLETAAERRAAGKPEAGTLRLHACHQGNQVVISVSDDGRGIDTSAVLAKAVARGMVAPEDAARLRVEEITDLIFEPGFSTAGQVTEISGRGVGMDVVQATVHKLKGTVTVTTEPGRGATFSVRLPLTLAIIRALLFRAADRLYAVPLENVLEIVRAGEADIHRVDEHEVLQLREDVLTIVRLQRLAGTSGQPDGEKLFVIVIQLGDRKFGLAVDKLVGEEELVIKPLDEHVIASELVSGASILGDGAVVLILNLNEVVRQFARARLASAPPPGTSTSLEARA